MRYNQIRECDIANGEGIGIALFVQGCHFKCKNCFNSETWDFNGGKEWTEEIENKFIELASKPYIKRISLLGGECLADENVSDVLNLVNKIHLLLPEKTIWLYTGYGWEQIIYPAITDDFNPKRDELLNKRKQILELVDVLIDGRYIEEQRNISLKWRGSENQRVIDIKKSLEQNKIVLWCD